MKRPKILRPVKLTTTFPEDIRAKLDLHLFSPAEGRVPMGAIQGFLIERIREYFDQSTLIVPKPVRKDLKSCLEAFLEDQPQEWWVDNFANPQEAYLRVRDFLSVL